MEPVFNLIWLAPFGSRIAVGHLVWAVLLGITIIGLPFARQHLKLLPLALFPLGRELPAVSVAVITGASPD